MRSKFALIIVTISITAGALLVVRQQRLQAVYEMTKALNRAAEDDRALWRMRTEIARRATPEAVRLLAESLGPLKPIPRQLAPMPSFSELTMFFEQILSLEEPPISLDP